MTLLERFDRYGYHIGRYPANDRAISFDEIRRAIAIAQAVEEDYSRDYKEIMRRADELLEGK